MKIAVRKPTADELKTLGVFGWPTWTCAPSTFDWSYSEPETDSAQTLSFRLIR